LPNWFDQLVEAFLKVKTSSPAENINKTPDDSGYLQLACPPFPELKK